MIVTHVPASRVCRGVERALPVAEARFCPKTLRIPPGATAEVKEAPFKRLLTEGGPITGDVTVMLVLAVAPL